MKPRNKFEKAGLAESKHLRPITKTQSKWAFRECIDHFAYRLPKGRITCMDCGHSWNINHGLLLYFTMLLYKDRTCVQVLS